MKKILLCIFSGIIILSYPSCKKIIDNQKENYILNVMTSGLWYLENVNEEGNNITGNYQGFEFKFYKNGNLDAIKESMTQPGTWSGDLNNLTFTSNFPSGLPLQKLNQVWKIKDYYPNLVKAESSTPCGLLVIQFRKK